MGVLGGLVREGVAKLLHLSSALWLSIVVGCKLLCLLHLLSLGGGRNNWLWDLLLDLLENLRYRGLDTHFLGGRATLFGIVIVDFWRVFFTLLFLTGLVNLFVEFIDALPLLLTVSDEHFDLGVDLVLLLETFL